MLAELMRANKGCTRKRGTCTSVEQKGQERKRVPPRTHLRLQLAEILESNRSAWKPSFGPTLVVIGHSPRTLRQRRRPKLKFLLLFRASPFGFALRNIPSRIVLNTARRSGSPETLTPTLVFVEILDFSQHLLKPKLHLLHSSKHQFIQSPRSIVIGITASSSFLVFSSQCRNIHI